MYTNPIGLFDSGVGGLTVLRALQEILPHENFIYLGDTARLPYGTKSEDTIIRYAIQCTEKLMSHNLKLMVTACNTVSSVALPVLQGKYPHIDVIGVVNPGAEAACEATQNNNIGIIGTESTIRGRAYEKAIHNINPKIKTFAKPSPLFVGMAEEGLVEGKLVEDIAAYYLNEFFTDETSQPDTLVLGCTHFPLIKKAIQNVVGNKVCLVDSAQTTAKAVYKLLQEKNLVNPQAHGSTRFITTDDAEKFAKIGELFLGIPLKGNDVELVDL